MTTTTMSNLSSPASSDRPRTERPVTRLRAVLGANAATSLVAGVVGTVAASWVSDTFGIPSVAWIRIVSIGLIVFAVDVALVARRARASLRTATLAISAADIAWVVGTIVVLATVDLTTTGAVAAIAMWVGVADFAPPAALVPTPDGMTDKSGVSGRA